MFYSPIVTVLEVNTVNLRLLALKRSEDFFRPIEVLTSTYDGATATGLNKPDKLFSTIQGLFSTLQQKIKLLPSKVYVQLPQTFIRTFVIENEIAINGKQVKKRDVDELYARCVSPDPHYDVISHAPVSFRSLNHLVMFNPIGEECSRLYGTISVVALEKSIKEFFDTAAKSLRKTFIYAGESNSAIEKADKDLNLPGNARILVNVRKEHISINLCKGKAIIASKFVEWGGNHIIYSLQDLLKINFASARAMMLKLNLNVNCLDADVYVYNDGEYLAEYGMKAVNKRVIDTLDYIAEQIRAAIASFRLDAPIPVYVTGHDVCRVRGVKERLLSAIGGEMLILVSEQINFDSPSDYPIAGLIEKIHRETGFDINLIKNIGRLKTI